MSELPKCSVCLTQTEERDAGILSRIFYLYCPQCKVEVDSFGLRLKPKVSEEEISETKESDKKVKISTSYQPEVELKKSNKVQEALDEVFGLDDEDEFSYIFINKDSY
jgi:hypothetical protein